MKVRVVSLTFELITIDQAVEAARLLAECIARASFEEDEDARKAATCIAAVLALVNARLLDVERVVRGDVDPARLLAAHNQKDLPRADSDEQDLMLAPWSPKRRLRWLDSEVTRARGQLRAARARGPGGSAT